MKNGIGPQNLGASGMNPKSTPCGHSVSSPINKLEDLSGDGKVTQKDVLIGRGVIDADGDKSGLNSGSPLNFQDDIAAIQDAASVLERHKIGGGGEVQGAAAAAQETVASQAGQISSLFGGMKKSRSSASGGFGRSGIGRLSAKVFGMARGLG